MKNQLASALWWTNYVMVTLFLNCSTFSLAFLYYIFLLFAVMLAPSKFIQFLYPWVGSLVWTLFTHWRSNIKVVLCISAFISSLKKNVPFFPSIFLQVSAALQTVSLGLMPCVHLPKKTSQSLKNCWKKRLPSLKNLCIIQVSWIHCFGNSVFHVSPVSFTIFLNDPHRFTLDHYIGYLHFNKSLTNNYFSSSLTVEVEDLKKVSNFSPT